MTGASPLPEDLDRGREAFATIARHQQLRPELVEEDEGGLVYRFQVAKTRYVVHFGIRRIEPGKPPLPPSRLLAETCQKEGASPLRLGLDLEVRDGCLEYRYRGLKAFIQAIRTPASRWKRHLLGGLDGATWLARAGGLSHLTIQQAGDTLQLRIDGEPAARRLQVSSLSASPYIDLDELCRSTVVDDECWLFTCGCGTPECDGIYSGIQVVHLGAFTIWRNGLEASSPAVVLPRMETRKAILRAIRALLNDPDLHHGWPPPPHDAFRRAKSQKGWRLHPEAGLFHSEPLPDEPQSGASV